MLNYELKDMREWDGVGADLVVTDPPFGIDFDGTQSNYNRDAGNVVDGYVEWEQTEYYEQCADLLTVLERNLAVDGNAIVFSGWNNSAALHRACTDSDLRLEGKLYWSYNFAPYCTRRPAHNVYELYWLVNGDDWYYTNECSYDHCDDGEANLSLLDISRDYYKDMPKYPTRLPEELVGVLIEHFSDGGTVFDPCAGSGMVGCVAAQLGRDAVCGDLNEAARDVFDELRSQMGV
jgi:DNA modification methylase